MKPLICLIVALFIAATAPGAGSAAGQVYLLDGTSSKVGFSAGFGSNKITGTIPVSAATLRLDFRDVSKSAVSVTLDAAHAVASFPFAAQAVKGARILDTRQFPTIDFRSTAVRRSGNGALVDGNLTLRGVTRPVTLRAVLGRAEDADPEDLDHLLVRLTGAISRSAFGASGWSDAVGDEVRLDIIARVTRVDPQ